jgi:hypothetical protein
MPDRQLRRRSLRAGHRVALFGHVSRRHRHTVQTEDILAQQGQIVREGPYLRLQPHRYPHPTHPLRSHQSQPPCRRRSGHRRSRGPQDCRARAGRSGIGASRPLPRVRSKVSFLKRPRAFSWCLRNWSSCPTAVTPLPRSRLADGCLRCEASSCS